MEIFRRFLKLLVLLGTAAFLTTEIEGRPDQPEPSIIGGEEAVPHSRPFQAFLEMYGVIEGAVAHCGGSVISSKYVMTAGHCCNGAYEAHILLGAHNITAEEDTQLRIISTNIKPHEDFNLTLISNDICVIELPEPLTFSDFIQPVLLPSRSDASDTFANRTATVSGWGLTDGDVNVLSEVLMVLNSTVMMDYQCSLLLGSTYRPESNLCITGFDSTGHCNGDSGGPLTVVNEEAEGQRLIEVGIVSFGVGHCIPQWPSAYTRVTHFLDWIEANTDIVIS